MTGNMLTNLMSAMGRKGDNMVGHLTKGDVVIPREAVMQNPEFLTKLKKIMSDSNSDYRTHIVGSGYENKNPHTGAPEFNWLSNAFHSVAKLTTSNPFTGQDIFGVNKPAAPVIPSLPAPSLGGVDQPFTPKRPTETPLPFDLGSMSAGGQQFNTLDPTQQRSYLATQGSQGGGISDSAKSYYLNLLQRNLIDEGGNMQNINTALLPVERNYLSRLGLPTGNTSDFLQALQQS